MGNAANSMTGRCMASPAIIETKDSCVGVAYEKFSKGNTDLVFKRYRSHLVLLLS
jgi:hypothetical protein